MKQEEKNGRNDLYVLANSYSGRLKSKKPTLLQENDFHIVRRSEPKTDSKSTPKSKSANTSSKSEVWLNFLLDF